MKTLRVIDQEIKARVAALDAISRALEGLNNSDSAKAMALHQMAVTQSQLKLLKMLKEKLFPKDQP